MSKLARFRGLFLPASIALALVVVAGWYYLVWLPSEHRSLDDRNFRLLTTLGEQISASINIFDKMMDNASDSGVTDHMLGDYLNKVAPQLKTVESEDLKVIGEDYGDPPNIAVRADEGTHFLYFAFQRTPKKATTKYAVRTDLDKLIRNLLPPADRYPFDVMLVAQSDGTVIFQRSSPGVAVARVDVLEDESGLSKTGRSEPSKEKSQPRPGGLLYSKFSEVKLAGVLYRLYSQPLQLSLQLIVPGKKSAEDKATRQPEQWVLCGLVRADAFRSESQSISYTSILWVSVFILLALLTPPFLKLIVSAPAERLRARDVVVTAVFTCVSAAAVTFILLDLYHWRKDFDEKAEDQMLGLADAIDRNFSDEQKAAFEQLEEFSKEDKLRAALREARVFSQQRPQFEGDEGACEPKLACRTQILASDDSAKSVSVYPFLQYASWSDSKGDQRVKWTTKRHVTPFINLDDPAIVYYPSVKRAFEDPGAGSPNSAPAKGIESQYSTTTGDNITVFWELLDIDGKPIAGKFDPKNVFCASLVTRPISVIRPIIPAEFQFAIIEPDGKVIFHSDRTRNLHENFFAETDQNPEVRSRVLMRSRGGLVTKYMGRGHRLYVYPMVRNANELWTVIIFRDLRVEETMNLEALSLASIMFVLYSLVMVLVLTLAHWTQGRRETRSWLWPDSRRAGTYRRLVAINAVAILLLFVLSELPMQLPLLFCATFLPAAAIVVNLVVLEGQPGGPSCVNAAKERWQLSYTATLATLLAAVAVLPCLSFFKVAWDFEQKLFIERSQLRLISDVNTRREVVRSSYQGVQLGQYENQLLAEPEGEQPQLFSYHSGFLNTTINAARENKGTDRVQCSLGSACNQQRLVESFLSTIGPLFNEIAYDGRYLTEAALDTRTWSLTSSKGKELLQLTKQEPDNKALTISSTWTPLHIPWGDWKWWLGTMAYAAALFWLVRFILRRIFLVDLPEPDAGQRSLTILEPDNLIAKLPVNMVVIGRNSSPTIMSLVWPRQEVQLRDFYQLWNAPMQSAAAQGGGTSGRSAPSDPIEDIVRDGHPLVFYNFEPGLDDPASNQRMLSTLEKVLSRFHETVVITSRVDPSTKASGDERKQWQTLLRSFVRIDLDAGPTQRAGETLKQFEGRISEEAYYDGLFCGRSRAQKLVLVQLAEEKLVNPNSRCDVRELMREGLVVRAFGMLVIKDARLAQFLKRAISRDIVKKWESQGAGRSNTLRTSLLVAGAAVVIFLLSTQGAVVNTWITYATGFAASIPALLKLLELLRRGPKAQVN